MYIASARDKVIRAIVSFSRQATRIHTTAMFTYLKHVAGPAESCVQLAKNSSKSLESLIHTG